MADLSGMSDADLDAAIGRAQAKQPHEMSDQELDAAIGRAQNAKPVDTSNLPDPEGAISLGDVANRNPGAAAVGAGLGMMATPPGLAVLGATAVPFGIGAAKKAIEGAGFGVGLHEIENLLKFLQGEK